MVRGRRSKLNLRSFHEVFFREIHPMYFTLFVRCRIIDSQVLLSFTVPFSLEKRLQ